ncbi:ATP-binding protein [Robiginitalea sp. SC105]|uniref:ATP-binding protein n=1 Tax=Robiginitalea sp. SC105 TaxID=2762332 RepID=UPI001639A8CB|nr:ATP-binding protein [Robiginitalea sp. SC105]MBC2839787.1 nuclear transport factor 2 family protein [Robiginitalea sp. SC105]
MSTRKVPETFEGRPVYEGMIEVFFGAKPESDLKQILHPAFMGYGTAAHEFFKSREQVMEMVRIQVDQLRDQDYERSRKPVLEKMLAKGAIYLIVEEFELYFKANDLRLLLRLSTILENTDKNWVITHFHGSTPDPDITEEEAVPIEGLKRKNEELEAKIRERTRDLEIEASLERIRAQATAMQESADLLDIVVTMRSEFVKLGHEAHYFWHMRWLPDRYDKAMTSGDGTRIGNVMELPRYMHGDIPELASWEKSDTPTTVYTMDAEAAIRYVDKMVDLGDFKQVDPQAPSHDDIRHIGGLTFVMARTTHGEIGYSLPGEVPQPPAEDLRTLVRFAGVFDLAYRRFEDLKKAERQKREAEIELALERVRAGMMAMHKSDELRLVIKTIFEQLQELDFGADASAVIIYDENYAAEHWFSGYTHETYPKSYTIPYIEKFAYNTDLVDAWKKGVTYRAFPMEGAEKTDYGHWLLENTDFKDLPEAFTKHAITPERLVLNDAFNRYGMLEVLGPEELTPENKDILIRFSKVFEQTYTRFLDLQKAEAQAREAQVETALERIRARSMAMQTSEELKEVIGVIFEQLALLKIQADHAGIVVDYSPGQDWNFWVADNQDIPSRITVPYLDLPWDRQFREAKENGSDFFTTKLNFEEKNSFYKKLLPHIPGLTREATDFYFSCPGLAASTVLQEDVALYIENFSGTPYSEEDNSIIKRFGKVFQQTYTRFLDLKKAEAQAREAQIETALERVRAKTMAMQKTEDIGATVAAFFKELTGLGLDKHLVCGINILSQSERGELWAAADGHDTDETLYQGFLDMSSHPLLKHGRDCWERGEPNSLYILEGSDIPEYYKVLNAAPDFPVQIDTEDFPEIEYYWNVHFRDGYLFSITQSPLPEEIRSVLERFASAFSQTFTRYLDLQKAEAQAREAQIEAALEKVRSRTMAMQHSDELPEAANVLFLEVQALGIPAWSCGYNIQAADNKTAACIMSSEGTMQSPFTLRLWGESSFDEMGEFVRGNETFLVQELGGQAIQDHYDHMKSFPDLAPTFAALEDEGLELPSYQINHLCKFSHGFLLFITYEKVPGAHEIFNRFTTVFDQTYTRFLDLKNMEAQARESKIETALERVRARALAMQEPEELKEVVQVLRREMGLLGVEELETSSIFINDGEMQKAECWFAIRDLREEQKGMVTDSISMDLEDTWVGNEILKFFISCEDQVSILMKGEARKEWISYAEARSKAFRGYYGEVIPDRTYHLYKFSHGAIGAATQGDLSKESWGLLRRTASVFTLAYSRFKDLTQARLDLQKLKEEKKRAEDALSELQLTQKQLIHSEKMASLGELTAGIAHEIQNPLNFVNNFSEVSNELLAEMQEEFEKGDVDEAKAIMEDLMQNLEKIAHHGRRAEGIVKGMLQHSRSGDSTKEPTDLNKLADEYLRLAYHGLRAKDKSFNASMETDFDPDLPRASVIPQDIGRVLLNLLTNAFHAVQERQKQVEAGYQPTVTVSTKKTNAGVEIRVTDNGGGIPEGIREKIFQPFFTTRPTGEGTGLGLSMSYDIVTKGHGGNLEAQSKPGQGSTFTIFLPMSGLQG